MKVESEPTLSIQLCDEISMKNITAQLTDYNICDNAQSYMNKFKLQIDKIGN